MDKAPRRQVLIIDDEPDHVATFARLLTREGHRVETATNPLYALTLIRGAFRPQVVFLDLAMPHMQGFELLRHIKRQSPGVRCYVVTGRSDDEARCRSIEAGCDGHFVKPVDFATIQRVLAA